MYEAAAEEVVFDSGLVIITAQMKDFRVIQTKHSELSFEARQVALLRIPITIKERFEKILKFVDLLEDDDDVQKVYHNLGFNEAYMN